MKNQNEQVKAKVQDVFGANAQKYVVSDIHAKRSDLEQIVEWLQPQAEWMALDIATGGGHVAKALSKVVGQVFAADLTRKMLEAAKQHLDEAGCQNVMYIVADAEELPFLDEVFDVVTCRIAPHHFPNPQAFVQETARVLKQGGRMILIDNVAPEDDDLDSYMNTVERLRDRSHVRCAKVSEWRAWFAKAGLMEERASLCKKRFSFPSWVMRTAEEPGQPEEVESFILSASPKMHEYFAVVTERGRVQSFEIDEWMAMFQKV
jgi:ubiquinone/menaquinone biosynthesis C-methylase UbiE